MDQFDLAGAAQRFVEDHQLTERLAGQLFIGVEQLDPIDHPVGSQVDVQLVADANCLNLGPLLLEAEIGHVVTGIVGQLHRNSLSRI